MKFEPGTNTGLLKHAIESAVYENLKPPPKLTVSQWADEFRRLSPESSAEPGVWRTDRAPYQRGFMDAYNDPTVETVVIMSSAQVGKTEALNNVVGYIIDQKPGPILVLNPTLEMSQTWSKDRLSPMLRDTPSLKGKVADPKSRAAGNTMLHKVFAGGHITMSGANSPASLASRPIRDVLADEIDRYPPSAGTEGDPVNLARKRTTTFHNRKIILTSTPTIKGESRIERAYEESDQRRYMVPCPHCDTPHALEWANVLWDKTEDGQHDPDSARMVCPECGGEILDTDKQKMLARGEWIATSESRGVAGFHINELYSPWRKFSDVVADFIEAKKNPETLKTWVNTSLGETWEDEGDSVSGSSLYARREQYDAEVPDDVILLTAGVDTQDDRLEITVYGWLDHDENYAIEHRIIYGDPGKPQVWAELTAILQRVYHNKDERPFEISAGCIDSGGHHTQDVYDYCKRRPIQRFYAIKGMAGEGRAVANPRDVIGYPTRKSVLPVGVDTAKWSIMSSLQINEAGPGYSHYPVSDDFDEEFFSQLTGERRVTKFVKGFPRKEWQATRPRVEALDCKVYAYAALKLLGPDAYDRFRNISAPAKRQAVSNGQAPERRRTVKRNPRNGSWFNR